MTDPSPTPPTPTLTSEQTPGLIVVDECLMVGGDTQLGRAYLWRLIVLHEATTRAGALVLGPSEKGPLCWEPLQSTLSATEDLS